MRGKLLFVAGAAVGYVLGARAGRKRYVQIKSAFDKVWQSPGIQKQVNAAEDFVAAKVGEVPGAVFDTAKKLAAQAAARRKEAGAPVPSPAAKAAVDNAADAGSDRSA
jgi:oxygen-dependent protoporphyrinogen oxidase